MSESVRGSLLGTVRATALIVGMLVASLLVAACSAAVSAPASTRVPSPPDPSAQDSADPSYSPQHTWNALATGFSNSGATSLDEATAMSEIVVVGRFVGLERGKAYGAPGEDIGWYATALIEIDEVLSGDPAIKQGTRVDAPLMLTMDSPESTYPVIALSEMERSRPDQPAVLFLVSWATVWDRIDTKVPDWLKDLDRYDLYRTIGIDGALPLEDGVVSGVVNEADLAKWRVDAAGASLASVAEAIAASEAGSQP